MIFDEFKRNCMVLSRDESDLIRELFADEFIGLLSENNANDIYRCLVLKEKAFYCGYLWDYLMEKNVEKENYIENTIFCNKNVFIMWDIHASDKCEQTLCHKLWEYRVIKTTLEDFLSVKKYFPEDVYLFDETFEWYFVLTHEYFYGKRYCLKYGI